MTFFGKQRSNSLVDQQAFLRTTDLKKKKGKRLRRLVVKLFVVFVLLFILLNLAVRLPSIYGKIAKPFNFIQTQYYSNKSISFDKRTNILLGTIQENRLSELALASLEPGGKKVVVLKIPVGLKVFDQDSTASLSELTSSQSGQPKNIDKLTAATLETLGYIPDGYIFLKDSENWLNREKLNLIVQESSFTPSFFLNLGETKDYLDTHLYTNLTIKEVYELTSILKKKSSERFEMIDLAKYENENSTLDQVAATNEIGVKLNDASLVEGNYSVEIINESGVEGLDFVVKGILRNLGVNIVVISPSSGQLREKTLVEVASSANNLSDRIKDLTSAKVEENKFLDSADVRVVLGKEFGKYFDY